MKPVIGVTPLWDTEKESIWMLPGYMDGISQAGGIPIILPFSYDKDELTQLVGICDGILFTGGDDVDPKLYGEDPLCDTLECLSMRDDMERVVFECAIRKQKPIFGICRGIQFLNVAFGGTLYQDLPTQHPSSVVHSQKPPYDEPSHSVSIVSETPLAKCLGCREIKVNSYHHQAIKDLAKGLEAMAYSPDGLIEAFCKPDYPFLWAVQWHPEFSFLKDGSSRKLFKAFVDASCHAESSTVSSQTTP